MTTITSKDEARRMYQAIFDSECQQVYPVIDALEARLGYAVAAADLLSAARVLACPLKVNPPNWQHGRVLFAVACDYLSYQPVPHPVTLLDIGTAKGFSALMLLWALRASGRDGRVFSVDVLDPLGREARNSVLECDGPKTLAEFLSAWPESAAITFQGMTGIEWLQQHPGRVHVAFVDGKHSEVSVTEEARLLTDRQWKGDLVLFDDAQIPGVAAAVAGIQKAYVIEHITPKLGRTYVLGRRR